MNDPLKEIERYELMNKINIENQRELMKILLKICIIDNMYCSFIQREKYGYCLSPAHEKEDYGSESRCMKCRKNRYNKLIEKFTNFE